MGVEEVVGGYSGGNEVDPSYKDVAYGRTGHREAVQIFYDSQIISFSGDNRSLLEANKPN